MSLWHFLWQDGRVTCWEILTQQEPWEGESPLDAAMKVITYGERLKIPKNTPTWLNELIEGGKIYFTNEIIVLSRDKNGFASKHIYALLFLLRCAALHLCMRLCRIFAALPQKTKLQKDALWYNSNHSFWQIFRLLEYHSNRQTHFPCHLWRHLPSYSVWWWLPRIDLPQKKRKSPGYIFHRFSCEKAKKIDWKFYSDCRELASDRTREWRGRERSLFSYSDHRRYDLKHKNIDMKYPW